MGESERRYLVRSLGALSLAGLLALVLSTISPVDFSRAAAPDRHNESVEGRAYVIDGDTIEILGTRVRLEGIDAPEAGQQCFRAEGPSWNCGMVAARVLAELVADENVRCEGSERDRYDRLIAVCWVGSLEINAEMVRRGLAWAFVRYSKRLLNEEHEARNRRLGIWQAENEPAWNFRAKRWAQAEAHAPGGCAIKGNISRQGRIYHLPGSAYYDAVDIDQSRGERWFCMESEAIAAGWRPALTN